jgi:Bifunctional DNA primase/polymerase, N-terminal
MSMTAKSIDNNSLTIQAALDYAENYAWPVFPCIWRPGPDHKHPLTPNGFKDASLDPRQIEAWWTRWPRALVGMPTGSASGIVICDVDIKHPPISGYDALDDLGQAILPETVLAHTYSSGLHTYALGGDEVPSTTGKLGPGLDTRGRGGYVILPSLGSGYSWDPHHALGQVEIMMAPTWFIPAREPKRESASKPVEATDGLSPYARAALNSACRNITQAPNGEQEATLNSESLAIGSLAASGGIPETFALRSLLWAGSQIRDYDHSAHGAKPRSRTRSNEPLPTACASRGRFAAMADFWNDNPDLRKEAARLTEQYLIEREKASASRKSALAPHAAQRDTPPGQPQHVQLIARLSQKFPCFPQKRRRKSDRGGDNRSATARSSSGIAACRTSCGG